VRGWNTDGAAVKALHTVSFFAYGTRRYGVLVSCGDIDGDGCGEIVTGPGPAAVFGPHVRAWDHDGGSGTAPIAGVNFFSYGTRKYGVNPACADIDGDGFAEILTGAGPGAVFGPHVRGWDYDGVAVQAVAGVSFFAYGTSKYGVNVSGGDLDEDGTGEIVTGPGPGQMFSAHVRGFNYDGEALTPIAGINFTAFPPSGDGRVRYGCHAAVADLKVD
jgi:serralysin